MIKSAIYRGRVRTVEDAVEVWKMNHDEAMTVCAIEDIVQESLSALAMLVDLQMDSWKQLRAGKLRKVLEHGKTIERAYRIGFDLISLVNGCIEEAQKDDYTVDKAVEFRQFIKRLEALNTDFVAKWPFSKREDIETAIASLDRGEGVEVGGLISELQGNNRSGRH